MHQSICRCDSTTCPGDRAWFYVTAIDGLRRVFLAGPYTTHDAALDAVRDVSHRAETIDPRAAFWAFGTARSARRETIFGSI